MSVEFHGDCHNVEAILVTLVCMDFAGFKTVVSLFSIYIICFVITPPFLVALWDTDALVMMMHRALQVLVIRRQHTFLRH